MNDDLRRRLERLADRGEPRGAQTVLGASRRAATSGLLTSRVPMVALAVAASVTLLAGVVAAIGIDTGDAPVVQAAATTTTAAGEPAVGPPVSLPMELIAASRLQQFGDCAAVLDFAKAKATEMVGPYGLPGTGGGRGFVITDQMATGDMAAGAPQAFAGRSASREEAGGDQAVSAPVAGGAGNEFSVTNVQEKGVDEPDTVKTDGRTIFALSQGRQLFAVRAADTSRLGSVEVNGATEMFLAGNRVIAISGAGGNYRAMAEGDAPNYGGPRTVLTIIDVSRPEAMKVLSRLEIDGAYVSSRLVGGVPRIVTTSSPNGLGFVMPSDGGRAAQTNAVEQNRKVIAQSTLAQWTPQLTVRGSDGDVRATRPLAACDATYRPPGFAGFGMVSVLTLDTDAPDQSKAASVMANGDLVYANGTHLYVATGTWAALAVDTRTTSGVPAPGGVVAEPAVAETLIHQFDVSAPDQAAYRISGKVRGTALNQFSMSEHEGHLRIATTVEAERDRPSESMVTVLAQGADALVQVGQVTGLGKTERIYAVRFLGDKGYVVTFRQVDPLYTLDLSDPARPRVVGELKITGYSAYLHPIDGDRLIGIGQEATEDGRRQGTQVSVFDVSDPAKPARVAQYHLPGGQSPAEFDHHAFLFWPAKSLLVVPYSRYGEQPSSYFAGAAALRVATDRITELGKLSHAGKVASGRNPNCPPEASCGPEYHGGSAPINRSLVVGDRLFTLSDIGLMASGIDDLAERGWVDFRN